MLCSKNFSNFLRRIQIQHFILTFGWHFSNQFEKIYLSFFQLKVAFLVPKNRHFMARSSQYQFFDTLSFWKYHLCFANKKYTLRVYNSVLHKNVTFLKLNHNLSIFFQKLLGNKVILYFRFALSVLHIYQ